MAFKPNYNQSRRERERAKDAKKLEKQQRREEATAKRKAEQDDPQGVASDSAGNSEGA